VEELYVLCSTGDEGKCAHLGMYVDWYMGNRGKVDEYRAVLWDILQDYCAHNSNYQYVKWSDLTPTQINELRKKYQDTSYVLNLEGQL